MKPVAPGVREISFAPDYMCPQFLEPIILNKFRPLLPMTERVHFIGLPKYEVKSQIKCGARKYTATLTFDTQEKINDFHQLIFFIDLFDGTKMIMGCRENPVNMSLLSFSSGDHSEPHVYSYEITWESFANPVIS